MFIIKSVQLISISSGGLPGLLPAQWANKHEKLLV